MSEMMSLREALSVGFKFFLIGLSIFTALWGQWPF